MAANTAGGTRTVRIWREGQMLYVQPPCKKLLRPVLRTAAHASSREVDGSLGVTPRGEKLFEIESFGGEPALRCWMGMAPIVMAALKLHGVPYHFQGGLYHAPLLMPSGKNSQLVERGLLGFISKHDRGIIHHDVELVQAAHLVAQVARAWPDKTITLVSSTRETAYAAVKQLRADKVDAFAFTARSQPWVKKRVAVSTFDGMAYNPVEPCKQHIVMVLNAARAIGKHARWCLQYAERARLYGLLPTQRQLSRYEQDMLRTIFGFEEVVVQPQGQTLRRVEVAWMPGEDKQLQSESNNILELKKYGIWQNHNRNRQLAHIALAFAAGDRSQLEKLLPRMPQLPSGPCSTFVLVENIEHVIAMMYMLPGWPVIASGLVNLDGLPTEHRAELERRLTANSPTPHACGLVTHSGLWHTRMALNEMAVLIRADGGTGSVVLPMPTLVGTAAQQDQTPLLVVDVDDAHDAQLRRHAGQRQRAYKQQGWLPAGKHPTHQRIATFLKRRLKGVVQ